MEKTQQNPVVDQTIAEEQPTVKVNWKKVAKYGILIGSAIAVGYALASKSSDEDSESNTETTTTQE